MLPEQFFPRSARRVFATAAPPSRRQWLGTVLHSAAGLVAGSAARTALSAGTVQTTKAHARASRGATQPIPIIDTHQHLWDLQQLQPPWLQTAPNVLRRTFHHAEYAAATAGLPVASAIYMEIDVHPDDHPKEAELVLEQIAGHTTSTAAAVISGRPNSSAFESYIRPLSQQTPIRGVRQVLHVPSAERGLCLEPRFVKSMQLLGELGLTFDLCMRPAELADAVALVRQCPQTQFILDHCGNAHPSAFRRNRQPDEPVPHTADQWKRDLDDLSACSNVACKISGVIASVPSGGDFVELLSPIINGCLDRFGPDRVVFGGDWPVCLLGASLAEWVNTLQQIVESRPLADQKKLWHDNAVRIYGLKAA